MGYKPPWSKFPVAPLQSKQESRLAGGRTRLPGLVVLFTFHVLYFPTSRVKSDLPAWKALGVLNLPYIKYIPSSTRGEAQPLCGRF